MLQVRSSTRTASPVRRRIALTAAVPLVLAAGSIAGPLAGAAGAVTTTLTATNIPVLAQPVTGISYIGPRAGFLKGIDPAHAGDTSISGVTPLVKVVTTVSSDPVTQVRVTLARQSPTDPAVSIFRDFDSSNGFALFKDVAGTSSACVAGTFDSCDLTGGQVSNGFTIDPNSPPGSVVLDIGLPSGGVSGATTYYVAVHPAAANTADRPVALSLNSFKTASLASATPPAAQNVTIDSVAPTAPARDSFTPQQNAAGASDNYLVSSAEAGKNLLFFASATSETPADVLRGMDSSYAYGTVAAGGSTMAIGDGTGISQAYGDQPAVTVARNGQTSNNVYARAVDFAGNVSDAANLDAGNPNSNPVLPNLQNDVTAPSFTLNSVFLGSRGVNATNNHVNGVSVFVTTTNLLEATTEQAQLIPVDPTGTPTGSPTGFGPVNSRPAGTTSSPTVVAGSAVDPTGMPDGTRFALEAIIIDNHGNATVPLYSPRSGGKFTTTYLKDGIPPAVTVAQVDPTGAHGTLTLIFSKPMAVSSLAEGDIDSCSTSANANCVSANIFVASGPSVDGSNCPTKASDFGVGATFAWTDKANGLATRAAITLGTPRTCGTLGLNHKGVVQNGDTLGFTSEIQDEAGNPLASLTHAVAVTTVFPVAAITRNLSGSDGFGMKSGLLDAVDVTFNATATAPAPSGNPGNLHVQVRGTNEIDAVTAATQLSPTVIRFFFTGHMLTGETPFVEAQAGFPTGGISTGSGTLAFGAVTASDGAPPVLLSAVTRDVDSPAADGKIDQVVLTWSEPIQHDGAHEAFCGYVVTGYTDQASGLQTCTTPYNSIDAASGGNKTVLDLAEVATGTDTDARPQLNYDPTANGGTLGKPAGTMPTDAAGNIASGTLGGQVADGAPPIVLSRFTRDLNNDGKLDAIDVNYSEDLNSLSLGNAVFTVAGHVVTGVSQTASKQVRVLIDETAPAGTGDTGALPKVTYVGGADGGLQDANSVPATPDAAAVTPTDGAGPAEVVATQTFSGGTPDQVQVGFSEPVKASTISKTSFKVVNGSSGDLNPTALTLSSDRLSAVLTLPSALDHAKDTAVRFAAAGAVTDDAGVLSTQTGPVIAPRQVIDGTYHAVSPARLLDTSHTSGPLGPNMTLTIQATGQAGIPASGVRAVVFNLQTFNPTAATYVTVWPAGQARPSAANLTAAAGQTISNLVTVLVGPGSDASAGKINLYNKAGSVDLFADVVGYYASPTGTPGSTYEPIQPARLLNTHDGTGGQLGPLGAGQIITIQAGGAGGVPASGVSAVAVHVMIQSPTTATYLTTYPTDVGRPQVASVTAAGPGVDVADLSLVKLGPTGAFNVYNKSGNAHVVIDVVGYYDFGVSLTGSVYRAAAVFTGPNQFSSPVRIVNSTTDLGRAGALGPGESFDLTSENVSGVTPTGVAITGYIMNVEVGSPTAKSYFTAWPTGAPRPTISQQTFPAGGFIGTLVQTGVSAGGKASIFNKAGFFDVFVDLSGFFVSAAPNSV